MNVSHYPNIFLTTGKFNRPTVKNKRLFLFFADFFFFLWFGAFAPTFPEAFQTLLRTPLFADEISPGALAAPPNIEDWKADGFPFFYEKERGAVTELWERLKNEEAASDSVSPETTGFISLSRQSRSFKGKRIRVEGRLLRTRFIPIVSDDASGSPILSDGYYESWVLLDDERQIPARLLTLDVPDRFAADPFDAETKGADAEKEGKGGLRRERIAADGIYYRQASYNAGDDFYNSPIVAALSFQILSVPDEIFDESGAETGGVSSRILKTLALVFLFFLWFVIRFVLLRKRLKRPASHSSDKTSADHFRFNAEELDLLKNRSEPRFDKGKQSEKAEKQAAEKQAAVKGSADSTEVRHFVIPFLFLMMWGTDIPRQPTDVPSSPSETSASAVESPDAGDVSPSDENGKLSMDGTFWREIAAIRPDELFAATSEEDENFRADLQKVLDRLERNIPLGLLHRHIPEEWRSGENGVSSSVAPEAGMKRSIFFDRFPENFGTPVPFRGRVEKMTQTVWPGLNGSESFKAYRLVVQTPSEGEIILYSPTIPKGWGGDGSGGANMECEGIGVYFHRIGLPILAAPRVGWLTDQTPLGRLGCDVSLFDTIPAVSPSALSKTTSDAQREKILANFRLSTKDRYPFYGFLSSVAALKPGRLSQEGERQKGSGGVPSVVELFNRPEKSQGIPVELTGHVRRARKIVIDDPEIRELYRLDHYYEIYLFTNDSQDYPILFCVPELPVRAGDGSKEGGISPAAASRSSEEIKPDQREGGPGSNKGGISPAAVARSSEEIKPDQREGGPGSKEGGISPAAASRPFPVGSGEDYREEVKITGFLYKPWAYKIDAANSPYAAAEETGGKGWITVPLMIGGDGVWFPDDSSKTDKSLGRFPETVIWTCAALSFVALFYFMTRRKSKPIEFKIGQSGPLADRLPQSPPDPKK